MSKTPEIIDCVMFPPVGFCEFHDIIRVCGFDVRLAMYELSNMGGDQSLINEDRFRYRLYEIWGVLWKDLQDVSSR